MITDPEIYRLKQEALRIYDKLQDIQHTLGVLEDVSDVERKQLEAELESMKAEIADLMF